VRRLYNAFNIVIVTVGYYYYYYYSKLFIFVLRFGLGKNLERLCIYIYKLYVQHHKRSSVFVYIKLYILHRAIKTFLHFCIKQYIHIIYLYIYINMILNVARDETKWEYRENGSWNFEEDIIIIIIVIVTLLLLYAYCAYDDGALTLLRKLAVCIIRTNSKRASYIIETQTHTLETYINIII